MSRAQRWTPELVTEALTRAREATIAAAASEYGVSEQRLSHVFQRAGVHPVAYIGYCPMCGHERELKERTGWCHQADCGSSSAAC